MTGKSTVWVGGAILALLLGGIVLVGTMVGAQQQTAAACSTVTTGGTGGVAAINASIGGAVSGSVRIVQANLPSKKPYGPRLGAGMARIIAVQPDFITLNEEFTRSTAQLEDAAPGFSAYRDTSIPANDHNHQARDTVVMWKSAAWSRVAAGRATLIDQKMENGVRRSRFATWVILKSTADPSSQIAVISTHLPVNPAGVGGGNGAAKGSRGTDYGTGMDNLVGLVNQLHQFAPVLVGGDFNDHPNQAQAWAAVPKMTAAGYRFTVAPNGGIDYVWYPQGASATSAAIGSGNTSDHPAFNATVVSMDGSSAAGSTLTGGSPGASCCGGATGVGGLINVVPAADTNNGAAQNLPSNVAGFTADQVRNGAAIVAAGKALNVPPRGIAIGLMTAYGESKLHNINHGDRDSIGLFQQRNNGAWGSTSDRMNPTIAASNFFKALLRVPGWDAMEPTIAAHSVQANADPNYYQQYWSTGLRLYTALQGTAAAQLANPTAVDCASLSDGGTSQISFTASGVAYVGAFPPDQLMARARAFVAAGTYDPFFHTVNGSWYRKCQHFVANLSGRAMSGYNTAADGWAHFVSINAAHPATAADGQSPPVGAWLYFKSSSAKDSAGHVVVYLGNNMIASTDLPTTGRVGIVPASAPITQWHQTYLGWAAPWGAAGTGSRAA